MRPSIVLSLALAAMTLVGALFAPSAAVAQTVGPPTATELAYFTDTEPFRAHLGENQQWLEALLKAMTGEQAGEVTTDELANLSRELFEAKQGFARARPSARLAQYDLIVKSSLDRAYTATVMMQHAQITESGPDRVALLRDAGLYAHSSGRLLNDAGAALREAGLGAS